MALTLVGDGNQEKIIEVIKEKLGSDPAFPIEEAYIEGGICYMLSIEWVHSAIETGLTRSLLDFNKISTVDNEENRKKWGYCKQIANNYFVYSVNASYESLEEINEDGHLSEEQKKLMAGVFYNQSGSKKRDRDFVKEDYELFVSLCSNKRRSAVNVITSILDRTGFNNFFRDTGVQYFLLGFDWRENVQNSDGSYSRESYGHQTAGVLREDGVITFYDPNYGVYEADQFDEIINFIEIKYFGDAIPGTVEYDICEVV